MRINYVAYYLPSDGYGRYNSRLVRALLERGADVRPITMDSIRAPAWMHTHWGISWDALTISSLPPYQVQPVPGRHWLLTMCEGSEVPPLWVEQINAAGIERLIVPCPHNAEVYARSGVTAPISVIPGGTDPAEFPLLHRPLDWHRPYTFLAIADRGARKGWLEVFDAFYIAFGGKTTGDPDVRLIVKNRPSGNSMGELFLAHGSDLDRRIVYQVDEADDMYAVYAQADCVVLPSRSEGWGMPHREAAMMGLPVITQRYAGLDDGHTHEWSIPVEGGRIERVPVEEEVNIGEWLIADKHAIAREMRTCYEQPGAAAAFGRRAADWLRRHQTWDLSAQKLMNLITEQARPTAAMQRQELDYAF